LYRIYFLISMSLETLPLELHYKIYETMHVYDLIAARATINKSIKDKIDNYLRDYHHQ